MDAVLLKLYFQLRLAALVGFTPFFSRESAEKMTIQEDISYWRMERFQVRRKSKSPYCLLQEMCCDYLQFSIGPTLAASYFEDHRWAMQGAL